MVSFMNAAKSPPEQLRALWNPSKTVGDTLYGIELDIYYLEKGKEKGEREKEAGEREVCTKKGTVRSHNGERREGLPGVGMACLLKR